MNCAMCGATIFSERALCSFHDPSGDEWSAANRTFCDLLHRGIQPPLVPWMPANVDWDVVGGD